MLSPNHIKNFNFQQTGRGTYKASDVDAFKQKIYTAYSELFSENSALKNKFSSLASLVEEYNEGKNAIAVTMIKAQTFADETIKQANSKAEEIIAGANEEAQQTLNQKKLEADAYYEEKIAEANAYHKRAEGELDEVLKEASKQADSYIDSVNEKAAAIIANANEQASKIVAAAYGDAQKARNTCDNIIEQANAKLMSMKAEVAEFRKETKRLLSIITPVVDDIDVPDDIAPLELSSDTYEDKNITADVDITLEPFKFNPYANDGDIVHESDESEQSGSDETEESDEAVVELTEEDYTPSVISEKLSASIFKSLDEFDKLIDETPISDVGENGADNKGNTDFSSDGSNFDITDFDED